MSSGHPRTTAKPRGNHSDGERAPCVPPGAGDQRSKHQQRDEDDRAGPDVDDGDRCTRARPAARYERRSSRSRPRSRSTRSIMARRHRFHNSGPGDPVEWPRGPRHTRGDVRIPSGRGDAIEWRNLAGHGDGILLSRHFSCGLIIVVCGVLSTSCTRIGIVGNSTYLLITCGAAVIAWIGAASVTHAGDSRGGALPWA